MRRFAHSVTVPPIAHVVARALAMGLCVAGLCPRYGIAGEGAAAAALGARGQFEQSHALFAKEAKLLHGSAGADSAEEARVLAGAMSARAMEYLMQDVLDRRFPGDDAKRLCSALLQIRDGRLTDAHQTLREVATEHPQNPVVLFLMNRLRLRAADNAVLSWTEVDCPFPYGFSEILDKLPGKKPRDLEAFYWFDDAMWSFAIESKQEASGKVTSMTLFDESMGDFAKALERSPSARFSALCHLWIARSGTRLRPYLSKNNTVVFFAGRLLDAREIVPVIRAHEDEARARMGGPRESRTLDRVVAWALVTPLLLLLVLGPLCGVLELRKWLRQRRSSRLSR